jgi:alanine racemase
MRHIANSTAAVRGEEFALDAVRIGSALTGRLPVATTLPLKKAGRLEAEVLSVRRLPKGSNLGYGAVYKLKKDTDVVVVGLGSADGFYQSEKRDLFRRMELCRYLFHDLKLFLKKPVVCGAVESKRLPMIGRPATTHSFFDGTGKEIIAGQKMVVNVPPLQVNASVERIYE